MTFPYAPRIVYSTPSFYSLTVGDGSWTAINGVTRTASAFPRWDGTFLDQIDDPIAAAIAYYQKALVFTTNGIKTVTFTVAKLSTLNDFDLYLSDLSLGFNRLLIQVNMSVSPPAPTMFAGTLVSFVALPDGSFEITCSTTAVVAASSHVLKVVPRGAIATNIGSIYVGNISAWDKPTAGFLTLVNSAGIWLPDKQTEGGEVTTVSGALLRYSARTDAFLSLALRFTETEYQGVSDWLDWVMDNGSFGFFDFYPRQFNTEKYTCWLETPAPGTNVGIRRVQGAPQVLELDVVLRTKVNNQLFDLRLSSASL